MDIAHMRKCTNDEHLTDLHGVGLLELVGRNAVAHLVCRPVSQRNIPTQVVGPTVSERL